MRLAFLYTLIIITQCHVLAENIATPNEELIYIVTPTNEKFDEPITNKKKIKDFLVNQQKLLLDQALDASGNALSLPWLSLGLKIHIGNIDSNTLYRDSDKLNGNQIIPLAPTSSTTKIDPPLHRRKWYRYTIAATPTLGTSNILNLDDGIKFPVNLIPSLGAQLGKSIEYELILPSNINNFEDEKLTKEMLLQVKGMVGTVFKFKMPLKADQLLNQKKYPNGSEFSWKMKNFAIFSLGLDVPLKIASAGAKLYVLIDGTLRRKLRVYREGPKTFAQLEIISEEEKSSEKSLEVNLGVNIFQMDKLTSFLKIRTLSASKIKVKNKSFKMSYVFDLTFPQAKIALDEALKNNFTKAQSLAQNIAGAANISVPYQGVLLLENHDQQLLKKVTSFNVGLFSNRFRLGAGPLTLVLNNAIPDTLHYSSTTENITKQGQYKYPYLKPLVRTSLNIKKTKNLNILWGILANRGSEINYNNEVITFETQGLKKSINQITFLENIYNKKNSEERYNKYYIPSRYMFQLLKPNLSALLNSVEQKNECYIDYKMNKHLILYPKAIERITNITPTDFYKTFARIFNSPFGPWWLNEKSRKITLEKHFKDLNHDPNMNQDLLAYINKMYSLYKKLDSANLTLKTINNKGRTLQTLLALNPSIENLKKTDLRKEDLKTAVIFHDVFGKYTSEPGFIDFISVLSDTTGSGDYFAGFIMKSKKCDIQWISSPQVTIDPEIISQEIESYLEDY